MGFDGLGHFKAFWGAPQVDGEVGTNKTPCPACDGCDNCLVGDLMVSQGQLSHPSERQALAN